MSDEFKVVKIDDNSRINNKEKIKVKKNIQIFSYIYIVFSLLAIILSIFFIHILLKNKKILQDENSNLRAKFSDDTNKLMNNLKELEQKKNFYMEKINELEELIKKKNKTEQECQKKIEDKIEEIKRLNKTCNEEIIANKENLVFCVNGCEGITQNISKILENKFNTEKYLNLNEEEEKMGGRKTVLNKLFKSVIHVGFGLDPGYVTQTMITAASILDSAYPTTKIIFHFVTIGNFTLSQMLEIYDLRNRLNNASEYNFYDVNDYVIKFKGRKGHTSDGAMSRLTFHEVINKNISKLLFFDGGDVIVLRDLTEFYNLNMDGLHYRGIYQLVKGYDKYINVGSALANLKKLREDDMFPKFVDVSPTIDQKHGFVEEKLINKICNVGFVKMRFGGIPPYKEDADSDKNICNANAWPSFHFIVNKDLKNEYNTLNVDEWARETYNGVVIHSYNGKWKNGKGLTIHRKIVQSMIKLAGIWDKVCKDQRTKGYCVQN